MNTLKHVFQRHSGVVILIIFLIITFFILYLLRNIILPFLVGLVIAYMLLPLVSWLEGQFPRPGRWMTAKRIIAIIIVFLLIVLVMGIASYYLVTTIVNSVVNVVDNAPGLISRAFDTILGWLSSLRDWLPAGTSQPLDDFINDLGNNLGNVFQNLFKNIAVRVPSTIPYIMGFATLPIFVFYILKDHEQLSERLYAWLPGNAARHLKKVAAITTEVLRGYLRAQLIMGLFVGFLALAGLLIMGAPLAVGLAVIAGVTELVPILGPWIGGGIATLVVLAIEPSKVIWVIVLFLAIQLIENILLVPRILGHYEHVHPAVAIVLLIIGGAVAGFWGLILIVPLASMLVRLYGYIANEFKEGDIEPPSSTLKVT